MEIPSSSEVLRALFTTGEAQLDVPGGAPLAVRLERLEGEVAWGLAPRLRVAAGKELSVRVSTSEEESWLVSLAIESAEYASPELATVSLRATAVAPHPHQRRAARVPTGGSAWLEALSCQEVADGDRVDVVLVDLSPLGAAFTTARVLRVGDQLRFHGRVFSHPLECVVRVAASRVMEDGRRLVGCAFLDLDPRDAEAISRVGRGEHAASVPQLDLQALREAVAPDSGGLLRRFRRGS